MRALRPRVVVVTVLCACLLLAGPAGAQTDEREYPVTEDAVKTFDVVVLRPFTLAMTLVGFALFIPTAIVTSPGGRDAIEEAWELFVVIPGESTFKRPLGDF